MEHNAELGITFQYLSSPACRSATNSSPAFGTLEKLTAPASQKLTMVTSASPTPQALAPNLRQNRIIANLSCLAELLFAWDDRKI
jgi:hypothetical protein